MGARCSAGRSLAGALILPLLLALPGFAASRSAVAQQEPAVTVLVAYYSVTGNTEKMAGAVAEGVRSVPGATAVLRKVSEVGSGELARADGIALGSPTYWGNIAGPMKAFIDDWWFKYKVSLTDKVGGSFASGGGDTGGKENVIYSLNIAMLNGGMIVAGPLIGGLGGAGVTAVDPVNDEALEACRALGKRIAGVARRMEVIGN